MESTATPGSIGVYNGAGCVRRQVVLPAKRHEEEEEEEEEGEGQVPALHDKL